MKSSPRGNGRIAIAVLVAIMMMITSFTVVMLPVAASAASAGTITLTPTNLVKDPSFEGVDGDNKSDVWTFTMDSVSKGWYGKFISNASRTGKKAETCWSGDDFTLTAKQDLAKVPAGKYTASAWISIGRADYDYAKITVKDGDKVIGEADLGQVISNDYHGYKQVKVEGIDVAKESNLTLVVSVKGGAVSKADFKDPNAYARIDDVCFEKTVPTTNLVKDPSFEGVDGDNKSDVWTFTMDSVSKGWYGKFISNASRTGKKAETCWSGDDFTLTAKQDLAKVPAGKYTASAWISLGRADYDYAKVTIKDGDKVIGEADLGQVISNDYNDYKQVKVEGIDVAKESNLTLVVSVKGGAVSKADFKDANAYARIDDVCFEKTMPETNLLKDPSFEGVDGDNKSDVWTFEMDSASKGWYGKFISNASRTGKKAETCWSGAEFTLTAKQDISKVPVGKYNAYAWISLGRADYSYATVSIKDGSKLIASADLGQHISNDYNGYKQVRLEGLNITKESNLTFIVTVKGGSVSKSDFKDANGYARIDDVFFGQEKAAAGAAAGNELKAEVQKIQDTLEYITAAYDKGSVSDTVLKRISDRLFGLENDLSAVANSATLTAADKKKALDISINIMKKVSALITKTKDYTVELSLAENSESGVNGIIKLAAKLTNKKESLEYLTKALSETNALAKAVQDEGNRENVLPCLNSLIKAIVTTTSTLSATDTAKAMDNSMKLLGTYAKAAVNDDNRSEIAANAYSLLDNALKASARVKTAAEAKTYMAQTAALIKSAGDVAKILNDKTITKNITSKNSAIKSKSDSLKKTYKVK